ncbi:hypothetical protein L915_04217 [Phytophthora nicotianae]|uniref:Transposase IS30-like HTH domain-containing protein n=1 Tax=Phytophthora nicotianae TaxID=4792 RepID=W2HBC5_PHYNI|nr:hypothetical protein L915_04217 [Phytophthora nicotianae]
MSVVESKDCMKRGRGEGGGVSARDIALLTERSRDTVGRIVAPPPPPTKLKCPGPPATLTVRETRRLVREASEGPAKAPAPD